MRQRSWCGSSRDVSRRTQTDSYSSAEAVRAELQAFQASRATGSAAPRSRYARPAIAIGLRSHCLAAAHSCGRASETRAFDGRARRLCRR